MTNDDDEKDSLIFRTNDGSDGASPTERVRVDSAGFVGINESAPSGILHVKGTSAAHGKVILEAGGSGGSANNNFVEFNKHDGTKLANIEVGETVTNGGDIVLKTTPASGSVTERMRVLNNGRVGIGTNSPANVNGNSTVLEVSGSGSNPPEIFGSLVIMQKIESDEGSAASYLWSTGNHPLIVATNGTELSLYYRQTNTCRKYSWCRVFASRIVQSLQVLMDIIFGGLLQQQQLVTINLFLLMVMVL